MAELKELERRKLMKSTVSIVMTTCKREPQIVERAIRSIAAQTYKDWELIVIDDSPDDYEYRNEVKACVFSVINHNLDYVCNAENKGACYSRNIGLNKAKGSYIAYLDDDDEWLSDKIEKQVKALDNSDCQTALVYGPFYKIEEGKEGRQLITLEGKSGMVYDTLMEKGNIIGGMSMPLLRTSCVKAVGGFDELMQSAQDIDLWIRIAKKYKVVYLEEPLVNYYFHVGEQITKNPQKKIAGLERLLEKNREFLEKHPQLLWKRTIALIPYYCSAGMKSRALAKWKEAVILCPNKWCRNLKELFRIVGNK